MSTRMDKYSSNSSNESRSSRNKKLYEELYDTMNYTNSVVIDQSKEIDISKIKEIVDRERKLNEKKDNRPSINFEELNNRTTEEDNKKVYNINEVLKEAKEKRDIILDASEKRKNSRYDPHMEIEEELTKTRQAYDKLIQEETELLDIMNTLTSAKTSTNIKEAYKDLTTQSKKIELQEEDTPEEEKKQTKEYSTNTFMFSKKDFIDSELEESLKGTNGFIKALIVILIIGVLVAAYYIIKTYILK